MTSQIYCERQSGDLCRMHSINNYFGMTKITSDGFFKYCDNYDSIIDGLASRNMDGFSEGRSIVSYIMDILANKFILLIPYNSYNKSRSHMDIDHYTKLYKQLDCFFEFNKNHIWVNKRINDTFYKIDSIGGVNEININRLGKNGYFLVIDNYLLYDEVKYLISLIKQTTINDNNYNDNNDNYDNYEIIFYNLYYCLKHIDTNIDNKTFNFLENSKFVENLTFLSSLKKSLTEFIKFKRNNGEWLKHKNIIFNIIKFQEF
jgi:hypothetical protein